jgi:hypothetical protein
MGGDLMAEGFGEIIAQLEKQKVAIDNALDALRSLGGVDAPRRGPGRPPSTKTVLSSAEKALSKRKGGVTPAGRKRLAEAMKRRWAAKRTAAQAKRGGRAKKAA